MTIKAYKPGTNSVGSGQVLHTPSTFGKARLVTHEMTDLLVLDLVEKRLVTDQLILSVSYDVENLTNPEIAKRYTGNIITAQHGRKIPKHAHGTANMGKQTSSARFILKAVMELYDRIVDENLLVRRVSIAANHVVDEASAKGKDAYEQLGLFSDYEEIQGDRKAAETRTQKERQAQEAILALRKKYGKNMILKGMSLEEGATAKDRNSQIEGHKA